MIAQIHTDLTDAHVYIFAHWTLSVLADKPHLSSAKFGASLRHSDVAHACCAVIRMPSACVRAAELVPYLVRKQFLAQRTLEVPPPSPSAALAKSSSRSAIEAAGGAPFRCCCFVMPADAGYCTRVTTVPAYLQAPPMFVVPSSLPLPWRRRRHDVAADVDPPSEFGRRTSTWRVAASLRSSAWSTRRRTPR